MTVESQGGLIQKIEPGSLGEHLGLNPGDYVLSINGHILRDEIDFRFYSTSENILLDIVKKNGEKQKYQIEKEPDDLMGISFDNPIFDSIKTCNNNCSFCFISQLPPKLRKSLYLRDDDYRLSFLFGNFISLTNLTSEDWARIDEQRLTPLRVSLHTSDPNLRANLMNNPDAANVMDNLKWFKRKGIRTHIQIVLLKGVNDGKRLISTLDDLKLLGDTVLSVGVVPAVYTRHRKTFPSDNIDPQWADDTLKIIEDYAHRMYKKNGAHWVYGADEFYFVSGRVYPKSDFYDDFPQYENGIGMVVSFRDAVQEVQPFLPLKSTCESKILAVTGFMAYSEVKNSIESLRLDNCIHVAKIKNIFFGNTVTCAGLLTGQDILSSLLNIADIQKYKAVLIPSFCVSQGKFLDDMTVKQLSELLKLPVKAVTPSPDSFLNAALKFEEG